ncbi:hypothetical protein PTSG_01879 [Salpingoeca rosetta]|uniref:PDEase domain-containing protein n=1 Tax=Salpingoeca rosetta (strain ATCC 50818 / BSB-021) TaxID=946362 RepID=F2TZ79_SALR5|nr:uncharacterized protein PTSG_01879 [Salpingoeca rosetta]EGD78903.1 hypothetical protein PTSG_01879 [Salpingoeca rosetta]|eukprot:XP_004997859.1 hypothetical protein PTSG_01879 [Salpingoeca rosetta]
MPSQQHQRLIAGIKCAFDALDVCVPSNAIDNIAHLVVTSMTGPHRVYHAVAHVFDVAPKDIAQDPVAYLAAIFHDVVYLQLDGGIAPFFLPILQRARLLLVPHAHNLPFTTNETTTTAAAAAQAQGSDNSSVQAIVSSPQLVASSPAGALQRAFALSNPAELALMAGEVISEHQHKDNLALLPAQSGMGRARSTSSLDSMCSHATATTTTTTTTTTSDNQDAATLAPTDTMSSALQTTQSWWSQDDSSGDVAAVPARRRTAAHRTCYKVFGHVPGETLPFEIGAQGLNEFLSCVIAVDMLAPFLNEMQLLHLCVCIEATIPFRTQHSVDMLYTRCVAVATEDLLLAPAHAALAARRMMHSACQMAARDVGNFAYADTRGFLANTWKLLPELNPALRDTKAIAVQDWMAALAGNWGFFGFLQHNPALIFPHFDGCRTSEQQQQLEEQAVRNLQRGRAYLGARLLSASIVHALAAQQDTQAVQLLAHDSSDSDAEERTFDFEDGRAGCVAYVKELLGAGFDEVMGDSVCVAQTSCNVSLRVLECLETLIFPHFDGCRTSEQQQQLEEQAVRNLQRGRAYLGARLLSASIVHALAAQQDTQAVQLLAHDSSDSDAEERTFDFEDGRAGCVAYVKELLGAGFDEVMGDSVCVAQTSCNVSLRVLECLEELHGGDSAEAVLGGCVKQCVAFHKGEMDASSFVRGLPRAVVDATTTPLLA